MRCEADNCACLSLQTQSSRDTYYGHRTINLTFTNSAL